VHILVHRTEHRTIVSCPVAIVRCKGALGRELRLRQRRKEHRTEGHRTCTVTRPFCPVANPSWRCCGSKHRTEHRTGNFVRCALSGGSVGSVWRPLARACEKNAPDICPVPGDVPGGLSGECATARKRFVTVKSERTAFKGGARGRPACTGQLSGALETLSGACAESPVKGQRLYLAWGYK
jgi:hypothetical protein